jgi:hypothetical protein
MFLGKVFFIGQYLLLFDFWCFNAISAIFQLYHGDQFQWWKKPEYPERTTDHGYVQKKTNIDRGPGWLNELGSWIT